MVKTKSNNLSFYKVAQTTLIVKSGHAETNIRDDNFYLNGFWLLELTLTVSIWTESGYRKLYLFKIYLLGYLISIENEWFFKLFSFIISKVAQLLDTRIPRSETSVYHLYKRSMIYNSPVLNMNENWATQNNSWLFKNGPIPASFRSLQIQIYLKNCRFQ